MEETPVARTRSREQVRTAATEAENVEREKKAPWGTGTAFLAS